MRFVRKAALALTGAVLAGGLITATTGPASASPAPKAKAAAVDVAASGASSPAPGTAPKATGGQPADSPALAAAATCPAQGSRIKTSSNARVYLVGPGNILYFFNDSTEYFALYSSYSGIKTVSQTVMDACHAQSYDGSGWELAGTELIKPSGTPDVYIYDYFFGGWRWITSQSVFDTYGFASSKIVTVSASSIAPIASNWT